jgi:ribosome biogenesis protein Nip4
MHTLIVMVFAEMKIEVRETYGTIKNRLVHIGDFFEATTAQGKMTLAKSSIQWCAPITQKTVMIKKEGKHDATKKVEKEVKE